MKNGSFLFVNNYIFLKLRRKETTLGARAVVKRHLDPDIFKAFIKEKGVSIRQLGDLCATTERTIRRCIKDKEVTLSIALDLCA